MNPSATGWIDKFGSLVKERSDVYIDFSDLYQGLKTTGFVYGVNVQIPQFISTELILSEDEKAKVNLLSALYFTYRLEKGTTGFNIFLEEIFLFYKALKINQISFLSGLFGGKNTSSQLEKLIDSRVYLADCD